MDDLENWATNPPGVEDCVLEIRNSDLTSLDALNGLERVNGFIIEDNALLIDIDVMDTIEAVPILTVRRSPLSPKLDVSNVLDDVRLDGTGVVDLTGDQSALALLHVRESAVVESISFPSVTTIGSVNVDADPRLENLPGAFPAVTSILQLSVTNSPLITKAEIEGLAAQAAIPAEGLFHCGNADDGVCEDVPGFD